MYVASSSDRCDDPGVISRRASELLQLLHVVDAKSSASLMPGWRDNLRKWVAAGLLQPLVMLLEHNRRLTAKLQAYP